MRNELGRIREERKRFSGTFVRYGIKSGWKGRVEDTILLRDIRDQGGNYVTDHLWFNVTKGFRSASLIEGDVVSFDARVKQYVKGYVNRREYIDDRTIDYKLSHPTKIRIEYRN